MLIIYLLVNACYCWLPILKVKVTHTILFVVAATHWHHRSDDYVRSLETNRDHYMLLVRVFPLILGFSNPSNPVIDPLPRV
jgi:hypothetical protein